MAPKKKAKEAPKAEPAAKKAKVEEKKAEAAASQEPKKEEPKPMEVEKAEPEEETELDDKSDSRATLKEAIVFDPLDSTLNVVPCGKVLMSLTEGGMQHLIAGARATVGMKAGRYVFEVKVIQSLNPQNRDSQVPKPRNLIRVGFSSAGSSLILGDEDSVCFDGEGICIVNGKREPTMTKSKSVGMMKFGTGAVVAVLLNLDAKSPNANTYSLFKDGIRISEPKPLPENLKGKPLFPHISFRNVSVQVNFGPSPLKALPFKCRLLGSAAKSDTAATPLSAPKDGKYELVLPVAFPDEGTFEWLDIYLEENPQYVELSDRKIIDWAKKSGFYPKSGGGGWKQTSCNDKPWFNFGATSMEDFSVRKVINSIAPLVPRNYLVMEVKSNLLPDERKAILGRFNYPQYKKIAHVVMGEPDDKFKEKTWEKILLEKQKTSDIKFKAQKAEEKRKKIMDKRRKDLEKAKAKAEKLKKKAEAEKKAAEEKKAKEEAEKKKAEVIDLEGDKTEEKKEEKEEKKEEEKKEEPEADDDDEEEEKEEPMEEEKEEDPPTVELTDEDKKQWFLKKNLPDLTPSVLSTVFSKFATPEEDEGFDEIRYAWQPAEKAKDYLKSWVQEKKLTQRLDLLQPSEKSKTKIQDFKKAMTEWQEKHAAHKKAGAQPKEGEKAPDVDIFAVENVNDVGGAPLYKEFGPEDWVLLQLRFEMFHLTKAFKDDTGDAERVIHEDHLSFYYSKYYGKSLVSKQYGVDKTSEVVNLVKDTVTLDVDKKILHSPLKDTESFDIFIKLTEESRRERQRRIDAGDETARLGLSETLLKSITTGKPAEAKAESAKGGKKGEGKGKVQYAPKKPVAP